MKILFTGLPYFGKKLVAELREFDRENTYVFCNTYYSRWDQLKFLFHLLLADRVVSFNGVTDRSRSLDWALRFRKKLIIQWHGSDVLTARSNLASGRYTDRYVRYGQNFTDAPWLRDELKELNISAELRPFKHIDAATDDTPFKSAGVLTYVAQGNETFYGINQINTLAFHFSDVQFHVAGTDGKNCESPANVHFHGWVDPVKMNQLRNENAIFMRLTAHDGYSLSVMEALANGNWVIWNNPHPMVHFFNPGSDLIDQFEMVYQRVMDNGCRRLKENRQWVVQHLDREKVLAEYVKVLTRS